MSAREFEAFLTRIYVDAWAREAFKANPRREALRAGLSEGESAALEKMDWAGLELAARSYAQKRQAKAQRTKARSLRLTLRDFLAALSETLRSIL